MGLRRGEMGLREGDIKTFDDHEGIYLLFLVLLRKRRRKMMIVLLKRSSSFARTFLFVC